MLDIASKLSNFLSHLKWWLDYTRPQTFCGDLHLVLGRGPSSMCLQDSGTDILIYNSPSEIKSHQSWPSGQGDILTRPGSVSRHPTEQRNKMTVLKKQSSTHEESAELSWLSILLHFFRKTGILLYFLSVMSIICQAAEIKNTCSFPLHTSGRGHSTSPVPAQLTPKVQTSQTAPKSSSVTSSAAAAGDWSSSCLAKAHSPCHASTAQPGRGTHSSGAAEGSEVTDSVPVRRPHSPDSFLMLP